ncbi:CPBP family intramembrane glutamic endopeptidase [Streptomyces sp. NPDC048057]|uniref:CPBP family intramembrane glutamic endopeptidase n=1 Tax=Streptomyces sp. NPDC048057 TaxID=3155628 RepID=UPI0033FC3F77
MTYVVPTKATPLSRKDRTRGLWVFLLITFGGAWVGMFLPLFTDLSPLNPFGQIIFGCMPALGAVVARLATGEGFADAGLRPRFRRAWKHYLLAWLGPLAFAVTALGTARVLGVWDGDLTQLGDGVGGVPGWAVVPLLMLAALLLTPIYWGEEFGWTSYLRPRLCNGRPLAAVVVAGAIWAVWHYPLAFNGYIEFEHLLLGLAIWSMAFLIQQVMLAALAVRSRTVWTASLAHAGNNLVLSLLMEILVLNGGDGKGGGPGQITVTLFPLLPMALVCIWILWSGKLAAPGGDAGDESERRGLASQDFSALTSSSLNTSISSATSTTSKSSASFDSSGSSGSFSAPRRSR